MMLPDTNLWLALALSKHTPHAAASAWLNEQNEPDGIFFCRSTQQSLQRLLTTTGVMSLYGVPPLSNKDAWAIHEAFIADDRIVFQAEPPSLDVIWKKLAAFAMASGAQLVTTDKAFSQFPGLDVMVIQPLG